MDAFGGGVERPQGDFDCFVLPPCITVQFRLRGDFIFDSDGISAVKLFNI